MKRKPHESASFSGNVRAQKAVFRVARWRGGSENVIHQTSLHTLAIDESWEPTPDVCGIIGPEEDPYPTRAIAVAIEVLSPDDRFTRVIQKCRKYADWGVQDILVFDPAGREAWYWDAASGDLTRIKDSYRFHSLPVELIQKEVFRRLDAELQ